MKILLINALMLLALVALVSGQKYAINRASLAARQNLSSIVHVYLQFYPNNSVLNLHQRIQTRQLSIMDVDWLLRHDADLSSQVFVADAGDAPFVPIINSYFEWWNNVNLNFPFYFDFYFNGKTRYLRACSMADSATMRLLMPHARLRVLDMSRRNCMHLLILSTSPINEKENAIRLLAHSNTLPLTRDLNGLNVLDYAARAHSRELFSLVLSIYSNQVDLNRLLAQHAKLMEFEACSVLIERGASVDNLSQDQKRNILEYSSAF